MSPIEQHLARVVTDGLANRGITASSVVVLSAEADDWRYRVAIGDRLFEIGFALDARAWAQETTVGREKHLTSNDHVPVNTSAAALNYVLALIARAMRDPAFPPRDPPVI